MQKACLLDAEQSSELACVGTDLWRAYGSLETARPPLRHSAVMLSIVALRVIPADGYPGAPDEASEPASGYRFLDSAPRGT